MVGSRSPFGANLVIAGLLLVGGAGCHHAGARLEGRWKGQRADGVAQDVATQAADFATKTEILAKGNQIAVLTPTSKVQATFFVDAEDKTSLVIHTDKDGPAARETFTFSDDGKTMTWRVDERRSIVFAKVTGP